MRPTNMTREEKRILKLLENTYPNSLYVADFWLSHQHRAAAVKRFKTDGILLVTPIDRGVTKIELKDGLDSIKRAH